MKTYTGGCHCGAVRFEVDIDSGDDSANDSGNDANTGLAQSIVCNCSHCSKKGFILHFVDADKFRLLQGKEHLTSYQFNKKSIDHVFCKICGVQSFAFGITFPKVALNVRCLDEVDLDSLTPKPVNGKDF